MFWRLGVAISWAVIPLQLRLLVLFELCVLFLHHLTWVISGAVVGAWRQDTGPAAELPEDPPITPRQRSSEASSAEPSRSVALGSRPKAKAVQAVTQPRPKAKAAAPKSAAQIGNVNEYRATTCQLEGAKAHRSNRKYFFNCPHCYELLSNTKP